MKIKQYDFYYYFALLAFPLVSGGVAIAFSSLMAGSVDSGNMLFQMTALAIYLPAFYYVVFNKKNKFSNVLNHYWPIMLLTLFCLASVLWSIEPKITVRRAFALVLTTFFCLYLTQRFLTIHVIKIITLTFFIIALFSYLFAFIPSVGIDDAAHAGSWKGLTGHKNSLGKFMAIAVVFFYYFKFMSSYKLPRSGFLLLFCFVVLLFTTSKTALGASIFGILSLYCTRFLISGRAFNTKVLLSISLRSALVLFITIAAAILLFYVIEVIFQLIGRDFTLTGRLTIWDYALFKAEKNFWLGVGYRTFWIPQNTQDFILFNPYWGSDEFKMANGHSGYIDVYTELGFTGFIIYLVFIGSYVYRVFSPKYEISYPNEELAARFSNFYSLKVLMGGLLGFYFLYCITEQSTLKQSDLLWMVFLIFYFMLKRKKTI